jgi:hypothetical protein
VADLHSHIFTQRERQIISEFIREKKRNKIINVLISRADKNWDALMVDIRLLLRLRRVLNAGY